MEELVAQLALSVWQLGLTIWCKIHFGSTNDGGGGGGVILLRRRVDKMVNHHHRHSVIQSGDVNKTLLVRTRSQFWGTIELRTQN